MAEQRATARRILATEAIVKTAAVEVKTLTLKGRQLTMAVFRQIPEEDIIDYETLQLKGVPWGWVNYHWSACPGHDHVHVVWQKGKDLKQALVPSSEGLAKLRENKAQSEALAGQIRSAVLAEAALRLADGLEGCSFTQENGSEMLIYKCEKLQFSWFLYDPELHNLAYKIRSCLVFNFDLKGQRKSLCSDIQSLGLPTDPIELEKHIKQLLFSSKKAREEHISFESKLNEQWNLLRDVDQLFIAV